MNSTLDDISPQNRDLFLTACEEIYSVFRSGVAGPDTAEQASILKGMFNLVNRRDRKPQWEIVTDLFDYLERDIAKQCASWCTRLRSLVLGNENLQGHLNSEVGKIVRKSVEIALPKLRAIRDK